MAGDKLRTEIALLSDEEIEEVENKKIDIDQTSKLYSKATSFIQHIPRFIEDSMLSDTLSKNMYSVTVDGVDINPVLLSQKKKGSLLLQIRGKDGKFIKTADLNKIDLTSEQNIVFLNQLMSVATIVTQQYYLRSIDDKLTNIKEIVEDIKNMIEVDHLSRIYSLKEKLQEFSINKEDIFSSDEKKEDWRKIFNGYIDVKANQEFIFYKRMIEKKIEEYGKKKTSKNDKRYYEELEEYFRCCVISLKMLIFSKYCIHLLYDEYEDFDYSNYEKKYKEIVQLKDKCIHEINTAIRLKEKFWNFNDEYAVARRIPVLKDKYARLKEKGILKDSESFKKEKNECVNCISEVVETAKDYLLNNSDRGVKIYVKDNKVYYVSYL